MIRFVMPGLRPGNDGPSANSVAACAVGLSRPPLLHIIPAGAVEALQLHVGHHAIIRRRGVDTAVRQQQAEVEIPQVRRLLHDVLAGEIVAALLQYLFQCLATL